ncbi:MAG: T9SS type A sorting domain-containing protein [Bacteroidales bacterium]|nr:T9SS type A sorting domain-containing protein [Bacteroidales bacterium]MCF8387118.1 T9SS type A sorting domain-containing protein [Bacteroidales bacterium]MCF8398012.1 T9SS type A sorting domain-containing protein [Bacteroidales bacterium]
MKKFTFLISFILVFILTGIGQNILVVDRDGSAWTADFTDCWPYYEAALDANAYNYTYYEVMDGADDGPDLTTMMDHDVIIWYTGEVWSDDQTMTANDEANLRDYLDDGGTLFFSGQDYLYDKFPAAGTLGPGDFPYDYLGVVEVAQDNWGVFSPDMGTIDGANVIGGYTFDVQDIFTSGREGLYIDEILDHDGDDAFIVTMPTPEGVGGIQFEWDAFKTVFTTVSFAAITDPDMQTQVLAEIVDWLAGLNIPPYFDPFEDYTVDDYLALQSPFWTTWSGSPGSGEDAMIVDEAAYSGTQSVKIEGSTTDLILPFGNKTEGKYIVSMDIMVEEGMGGYYNLLHLFDGQNSEWAMEVYFASDGTGELYAANDGNPTVFNYPNGEWFNARVEIDLDIDHATYLVNDEYVFDWQWSMQSTGDPGMNQLGAMDIFAAAPTGDDVGFYFDNIYYYEDDGCELFEEYIVGEYLGLQSPFWTTWSEDPGSSEDAMIDWTDPYTSVLIEGTSDLVRPFSYQNLTENSYSISFWIMVADGHTGYFNLQKDIVPGVEWGMQMMFENDGVATLDAGGEGAATFNYDFDVWYFIEMTVDLDNDLAEIYIDDDLLHTWQWTLGTFGDPGALTLGSMNVYAWEGNSSPMFWIDDVCFEQLTWVGKEEVSAEVLDLTIFPNPVKDNFYLNSNSNIKQVFVYNSLGQLVLDQQVNGKEIQMDIQGLKTGVYLLKAKTNNGIETRKLIVE